MQNDLLSPYDQNRPLDVAGRIARDQGTEKPQPTAIQTALAWSGDGGAGGHRG